MLKICDNASLKAEDAWTTLETLGGRSAECIENCGLTWGTVLRLIIIHKRNVSSERINNVLYYFNKCPSDVKRTVVCLLL